MKDYYAILEISTTSTKSDIRKAYRKLAKKYHPDINKSENAHEKFIEISEAYEILINQKQVKEEYANVSAEEQSNTDDHANEEFEQFRQEAREKARQRAKMRYDEFKKQDEAYKISGLYDAGLLINYAFRLIVTLIPLLIIYLTIHWILIKKAAYYSPILVLAWIINIFLIHYLIKNRGKYLKIGGFYYTFSDIKRYFTETKETSQKCYYCSFKPADSKPYKLNLLKLKDIKVKSEGFRQHNANYVNENALILVPRSRKALFIHSVNTGIKIVSILSCLVFLDISSLVWRIIVGMAIGGIISSLILLFSSTKSNVSYLLSYGTIFRIWVWIFIITMISHFSIEPFNITTSDYIYLAITAIVLFDCFLMQLVNFTFRKYSSKPLTKQYAGASQKFNEGYKVYNDVTVISVVYPLFKWIFG
jgi:hypothetical protein